MAPPSTLLIAYDAECSLCCRMVDRIRARDRKGHIVFFPLQNRELVALAPELAGRALQGDVHGVDLRSRRVWVGAELFAPVMARLPRWRWIAPLFRLPGVSGLTRRWWRRWAERRFQKYGRQPFQDRFH